MASGVVGSLLVKLAAATADFDSSMKSSAEKIGKTKKETDELAKSMKDIGHIGGGVAIGNMISSGMEKLGEYGKEAVHYFIEVAAEMNKLEESADKMGISILSFEILSKLADKSATSIETVGAALTKMKRKIAEGDGIGEIGLDQQQLEKLAPEAAFETIAKRIAAIQDPMQRAKAEMDIFGKSGAELDGVIRKLSDGYDKWKDSVADPVAVKALAAEGEAIEKLEGQLKKFATEALGKLAKDQLDYQSRLQNSATSMEFFYNMAKRVAEFGGVDFLPNITNSTWQEETDAIKRHEAVNLNNLEHAKKINEELQKQKDLLDGIGKTKEEQDRIKFISENKPTKKELADYDAIHSKIMEQTEAIKEKKRVGEDWDKIITEELKSADRLSEKMKTFGEKLRDMDPLQKFKEQMKEIDDWLKYLGDDVTDAQRQAASEAVKQMRKDAVDGMAKNSPEMEPFKAFSNAAMAGTAEAQNTILRARYGTADNSKIQKQIDLATEQVGLLKSLPEIAKDIKPQVVPL